MAYSTSRLSTYKRCRLKYFLTYGQAKREQIQTVPLLRGSSGHAAMAAYYSGKSRIDAIQAAWDYYAPACPASLDGMLKLDAILDRYFRWAKLHDKWKVIMVEETIEVAYQGEKLMGIVDLLVEKNGQRYIVDHKFQKSQSFSNLPVDAQVSQYLALMKLAGIEVRGLIYNIVNIEPGPKRTPAFREVASRTPAFLDNYLADLIPQIQEIKLMDSQQLPIYPNYTKDCSWDCSYYRQCCDTSHSPETRQIVSCVNSNNYYNEIRNEKKAKKRKEQII